MVTEGKKIIIVIRRIFRSGTVQFDCVMFEQESSRGYCFTYVSTANSGAVTEQTSLCLPTVYQPGTNSSTIIKS